MWRRRRSKGDEGGFHEHAGHYIGAMLGCWVWFHSQGIILQKMYQVSDILYEDFVSKSPFPPLLPGRL